MDKILRELLDDEKQQQKYFSPFSRANSIRMHSVIATYNLNRDLGNYGEEVRPLPVYGLTEDVRDRLIAHAREDASLAVVIAAHCEKRLATIKYISIAVLIMQVVIVWLLTT